MTYIFAFSTFTMIQKIWSRWTCSYIPCQIYQFISLIWCFISCSLKRIVFQINKMFQLYNILHYVYTYQKYTKCTVLGLEIVFGDLTLRIGRMRMSMRNRFCSKLKACNKAKVHPNFELKRRGFGIIGVYWIDIHIYLHACDRTAI
jgi:hypothetical protein